MRAPGLAWRRLPLFSWAATVIGYILLVIGPAMLAALAMLMVDRHFDGVFFDAGEGGAPLLYEHLSCIFLTGCYLIVFLAAAGAISEILPTFARKPIFSHRAVAGSFVAIGVLGPLAWMQNMYIGAAERGLDDRGDARSRSRWSSRSACSSSTGSRRSGAARSSCAPPPGTRSAAISTMSCGLAGELGYSVIPVGWALDNTTASQGDTLYVLVGGGVFGGFAALHYWFPKLSGRLLGEGVGKVALLADRCRHPHLRAPDVPRRARGPAGRHLQVLRGHRRRRLQPDRLDRRLLPRRSGSCSSSATPPTAGTTGCPPAATTRGAARRSSGSRSRRPRRTTSTPSPTSAAPSRCTTSANGRDPRARVHAAEPLDRVGAASAEEPDQAHPEARSGRRRRGHAR